MLRTENPLVKQRIHEFGINRLKTRFNSKPKNPFVQWDYLTLLLQLKALDKKSAIPFKFVFTRYANIKGLETNKANSLLRNCSRKRFFAIYKKNGEEYLHLSKGAIDYYKTRKIFLPDDVINKFKRYL